MDGEKDLSLCKSFVKIISVNNKCWWFWFEYEKGEIGQINGVNFWINLYKYSMIYILNKLIIMTKLGECEGDNAFRERNNRSIHIAI